MKINFDKNKGLVPVVVQDANTSKVLMLGYMNEEALNNTIKSGNVTFYSRSKERLWMKGESSGNVLKLVEMTVDCDNDTLLVKAIPSGPVCHKGTDTCFNDNSSKGFLYTLEAILDDRITAKDDGSYTYNLYQKGINKMAQKVGEEAVELLIEAKDDNQSLFENEAADLLYHYLLLLNAKNTSIERIEAILEERHQEK